METRVLGNEERTKDQKWKKNKLWECFKAEKSQDKIVSKMEKEQMCFRNTNP